MLLAALIGGAIGVSLGMLGGGGSILAVPALVYLLGQPVRDAVPTSLLVVGGSAAAGALSHLRAGKVPWRSALLFGAAGIGGSFAGAWFNHRLAEDILLIGFSVLMLAAAAAMLRNRTRKQDLDAARSCENAWRERPVTVILVGLGVGVLTGLFGVGGGFILVPAWTLAMGCPVQVSVGASLLVVVMNSGGALIAHSGVGSIDMSIALPFAGAAIVGAIAGERLGERVAGARLSQWFAYMVIGVALFVLTQVLVLDGPTT
jgi:uncharacterized protein